MGSLSGTGGGDHAGQRHADGAPEHHHQLPRRHLGQRRADQGRPRHADPRRHQRLYRRSPRSITACWRSAMPITPRPASLGPVTIGSEGKLAGPWHHRRRCRQYRRRRALARRQHRHADRRRRLHARARPAGCVIEVSPTAASQLKVLGNASLAGNLALVYEPGVYSRRQLRHPECRQHHRHLRQRHRPDARRGFNQSAHLFARPM